MNKNTMNSESAFEKMSKALAFENRELREEIERLSELLKRCFPFLMISTAASLPLYDEVEKEVSDE